MTAKLAFLLAALALSPGWSQTNVPFSFRFQQGQNVTVPNDGGTLTLPADGIGQTVSGTLSITYRGAVGSVVTINSADLTGSLDFQVSGFSNSFNMTGGETVTAGIRYLPTTGNRVSARLVISYTEGRVSNSFTFNLVGTAPDFAFSYVPPTGPAQPLTAGGTLSFPPTAVESTSVGTLLITNRGSGPGTLASVSVTGAAFQLVGAPLAGTVVDGGREVRVGIAFTPRQPDLSVGSVRVELSDRTVPFTLEGTGATAQLIYEVITESGARAVLPEQTIALPDTVVNERSTLAVRVRNAGNAEGRVAALSVSGTGITLADLPPLPVTLAPGNRFSFTLVFAPPQPGTVNGRLRIGQDQFDLTGRGLGPVLSYSSIVSGVSSTVQPNGPVNFVSTAVGATSSVQFQISNTGTAPGNITSISIPTANAPYELTGLPSLPLTLQPNASVTFGIRFVPVTLGAATATLRIDGQTFTLNGVGSPPAPLPAYTFGGASGVQEPLAQPAVSLTLAEPYPLALNGTLTLAFNSDVFANDPSVQFAAGGRTVNFTIPANSRQAVFANNATTVRLQTGTVAGTLTLTPSFVTDGGINLTPTRPAALNLTVAPAAPRIIGVVVSARTNTSITLLVTGYSTSRSITGMELAFTAVSGENLTAPRVTLPVEPAFLAWYQSAASQAFGSLFTATVPLTLSGELASNSAASSLVDALQSVAVTARNAQGTSAALTVNLK